METQQWAQRLEDLSKSYAFKDVLKEAMTLITWHCTTKGPNLHVAQAHLRKSPTTLGTTIFRANHLVRQLRRNLKSLMLHEFQQCLPHPLVFGKDKVYQKFLPRIVWRENFALEIVKNGILVSHSIVGTSFFSTIVDNSWFWG